MAPPISGGPRGGEHFASRRLSRPGGGGGKSRSFGQGSGGAKKYILKAFLEILRHADKPNFGFTEKTVTCTNNFDLIT